MNFKNMGSSDGDLTFPLLPRQLSSVFSLTLHEYQSTLGAPPKEFGSMNMDELLRSIWTAEEASALADGSGAGASVTVAASASAAPPSSSALNRQGSLTLPRTVSQKTVDEVLRDFQNPNPALSEMTLEEFLVRAGVVREDGGNSNNDKGNNNCNANNSNDNKQGFSIEFSTQTQIPNLGARGNNGVVRSEISNNLGMGVSFGGRGYEGFGNQKGMVVQPGLMTSPVGIGRGNRDSSSPVEYVIEGGGRGRKRSGVVEKVVERRQKRMIKNRESAARSRARKQAYTMELEDEVAKLKEQNQVLLKKQADIMEMQKNQVMEKINQQRGPKKLGLRRTQTGPW